LRQPDFLDDLEKEASAKNQNLKEMGEEMLQQM
jgi:hypothetical protein